MIDEPFTVKIPDDITDMSQDREYCILVQGGQQRRIRLHDYHEIYNVPGLYEYLFEDLLQCKSPEVVTSALVKQVDQSASSISDLVVLELGAGNGMVGETMINKGIETIVGIDIIDEAAQAARRDRPGVYADYLVEDLCNLPAQIEEKLNSIEFDCLVSVAALGFGDIPPLAFANAYNLIADDGWIAFNIKAAFLKNGETSGFARLLESVRREGIFEVQTIKEYQHRLALDGRPLDYVAVIGKKHYDIPDALIDGISLSRKYPAQPL